jgi:hypothetical protein
MNNEIRSTWMAGVVISSFPRHLMMRQSAAALAECFQAWNRECAMRQTLQHKAQLLHLSAWNRQGIATRGLQQVLARLCALHVKIWREHSVVGSFRDQDRRLELQVWTRRWVLARKIKSLSGWQGFALSRRNNHGRCAFEPSQSFSTNFKDCGESADSRRRDEDFPSADSVLQEETAMDSELVVEAHNEERMEGDGGEVSSEEQQEQGQLEYQQEPNDFKAEEVEGEKLQQSEDHEEESSEPVNGQSWRPRALACLQEEDEGEEEEEHMSWLRVNSMLERLETEAKSAGVQDNTAGGNASTVDDGSLSLLHVRKMWEKKTCAARDMAKKGKNVM